MRYLLVFFLCSGCVQAKQPANLTELNIHWPEYSKNPRITLVDSIPNYLEIESQKNFFDHLIEFILGESGESNLFPFCVEKSSDGKVFIVDSNNNNIQVFDEITREYYTLANEENLFESPIDIAIDNITGRVYVSDSTAGAIHLYEEWGKKYLTTFGKDFLSRPTGISVNQKTGELVIVDTLQNAIIICDLNTLEPKRLIGTRGNQFGEFNYPTHLSLDDEGNFSVTDTMNFRIQKFSSQGDFLFSTGTAGDQHGYLSRPRGNATDSDGNIYIVDALKDAVQIFNKDGELLLFFGGAGNELGKFWLPAGIFIDQDDKIYVADTYNYRVQVFQYIPEKAHKAMEQ